jgi:acyl-CoA dehydrogenase
MIMVVFFSLIYLIFTLLTISFSMNSVVWQVVSGVYLIAITFVYQLPWIVNVLLWLIIGTSIAVMRISVVRDFISREIYKRAKTSIPTLSKTEEEALKAGDTWQEEDIFRGEIDWEKTFAIKSFLTPEEQAFLDHETSVLCSMVDDWDVTQKRDLPPEVWSYMKDQGFFGLVISKEYGGKGFSARAHSDIVAKVASRSGVAAVTVMVPNSLGPGELLQHYGTDEQKQHYLPRLAKGLDIPCFALTEPEAGSDATSIQAKALVVERKIKNKLVLGLSITLEKRWITLAPVATLIGVAVDLQDPDNLLKGVGQVGITCVLIARDTENLEIGNRHLPSDQPFMNGTIRGKDIFVPITQIIGGQEKAGSGWQMLVECLSIGRAISLPSLAMASSGICYVTAGAFAQIRRQFNVPIGHFEGIEEKLAEIAGLSFITNATRLLTVAAVDTGIKPSVSSAITKYFNTELARIVINNSMDIHAGRAVVVGPRNYMTNYYHGIPISVTVEGANIMSRNLLIFGQGSMACHPFIREEFYAIKMEDEVHFKALLWQHINYFLKNFAKALCSAWTNGYFLTSPKQHGLKREYQKVIRLSHAFAFLADFALIYLGGALKRKERLSARLADVMSYLYLAKASLKLAADNNVEMQLHAVWAVTYCTHHAQKAIFAFCNNLKPSFLGSIFKILLFPQGRNMHLPNDKLDHDLASLMMQQNVYRSNLLSVLYVNVVNTDPVGRMEYTLRLMMEHKDLYDKFPEFKKIKHSKLQHTLKEYEQDGKITTAEMRAIMQVEQARWDAITVDEFSFDSLKSPGFSPIEQKD